jgi:hypothetical protein
MIGKMFVLTAALLLSTPVLVSTPVLAQTSQSGGPSPGVTTGPAAGSPTSMGSPQAGPLETKHQGKVLRNQSQSVQGKAHKSARNPKNDETGATGSSSPNYAPPPR